MKGKNGILLFLFVPSNITIFFCLVDLESFCESSNASCQTSEKYCKINQNDLFFCSNRGNCNCGKCECLDGFDGEFCENCLTAICGQGAEYKDCVHCTVFMLDDEEACQDTKCHNVPPIQIVDNLTETNETGFSSQYLTFIDANNCKYSFTLDHHPNGQGYIRAQRIKECSSSNYSRGTIFWIVFGVVGTFCLIYGVRRFFY